MICKISAKCGGCDRPCMKAPEHDYAAGELSWMNGGEKLAFITVICRRCGKEFTRKAGSHSDKCGQCKNIIAQQKVAAKQKFYQWIPGALVKALIAKDATMYRMCKTTGIDFTTGHRWLKGKKGPSEAALKKACKFLGVKQADLVIPRKHKAYEIKRLEGVRV